MASLTGRVFGHYHILEIIGRGGMATVYRAHDRKTGQEVAVKFISPAVAENDEFLRRFRREVKVVARMSQPHILPVLDYGEQDGYAYLVMPVVELGSLADRLQQGGMSLEEGGVLFSQVAGALSYAHQKGVIHRDVKPSNILLDASGNALLADFGLARPVEASLSLTGSAVIGTPAYMAPEQIQGGKVDARCDQYALGVLLFQLSTGSLPYQSETPMGYLLKHVNEEFPSARARNPHVPQTIESVIRKATAKDPEQRFESVADLNAALQASLAHVRDPHANRAPTIQLPRPAAELPGGRGSGRRARTLRVAAAAVGTVLLILVVPVFASGLVDMLERAQSPAEGSAFDLSAIQLAATIEAMSTALASSPGTALSASEIETAVVRTLSADNISGAAAGTPAAALALAADTQTPGPSPSASQVQTSDAVSGSTPTQTTLPGISSTPVPSATTPVPVFTPTPTRTPTSSATPTPSHTPTRTPTLSATPTPSHTPTRTPTRTPTLVPSATADECSLISVGGFQTDGAQVWWTMSSAGSSGFTISRIVLNWPAQNGELDRIRFDSSSIWNGDDDSPPSDISSGWTGNRSLGGGATKDLVFEFGSTASTGGYSLEVYLDPACQRSAGG